MTKSKNLFEGILFYCLTGYAIMFLTPGCVTEQKDGQVPKNNEDAISGSFMNMKPTAVPTLLAPEILASSLEEYNGTFNPTGTEFYFTTNPPAKGIICYSEMREDGQWTKPKVAPFSGKYSEYDPLFSPDGSRLYFSSERPTPSNTNNTQTNIWYIQRQGSAWSDPFYVDLINHGNYYSSLTHDGTIYFNIWNNGDLFKATPNDMSYDVDTLPSVLNTMNGEGDPFISPEEDYLIFRGYNNSLGLGDLYISFRINDEWTEPENLGAPINSPYHEICPYVTADKQFFIFASSRLTEPYASGGEDLLSRTKAKHQSYDNGELNIYYISADFINKRRTKYEK